MKRVRYFITCGELEAPCVADVSPDYVRRSLTAATGKERDNNPLQLTIDFGS